MYRSMSSASVWRFASEVNRYLPSAMAASIFCAHLRASVSRCKVADTDFAPLRRTLTRHSIHLVLEAFLREHCLS